MKAICMMILLALAGTVSAQEVEEKKCEVNGTLGVDLTSQYIWRGQNLGDLSLQPTLGIDWKGLSLSAWGSVGISNFKDTKELDLTLAYGIKGFNVGITDYWFTEGANAAGHYLAYKAHNTNHVFEGNVGYEHKYFSIQWYTNFAGNDAVTSKGKRAYSSYCEISAPFSFVKCDWDAAVGIVPYASDYYGTTGFHVTNVSLKASHTFNIKQKLDIPLYANVIVNPCSKHAYFVVGTAFNLNL